MDFIGFYKFKLFVLSKSLIITKCVDLNSLGNKN